MQDSEYNYCIIKHISFDKSLFVLSSMINNFSLKCCINQSLTLVRMLSHILFLLLKTTTCT